MASYQEIVQKIGELQKQAEEIKTREQAGVISEIRQKISEYGITPEELGFGGKHSTYKKATRKVAVRYRNPKEYNETWTGRGKRPSWLSREIGAGRKLEDFLIAH